MFILDDLPSGVILLKQGEKRTREEVIERYKKWILNQPQLLKDLNELKGKKLGCWCKPKKCHGDILIELIEKNED